jgi:F-type H+-transporting ATPase subunit gamma
VIGHLAQANPEVPHPYLVTRDAKRVGFIIVSTDRGLAGGLNINLFKTVLLSMRDWQQQGAEVEMCLIGQKATQFFRRFGGNIVAQTSGLGDRPRLNDLIGTVKIMLDAYKEGRIDRLFVVYNNFINTMSQKPEVMQLLPVQPVDESEMQKHWDYIYEPGAAELLDGVLMRYIESQVYQAVLENVASEHAARMVAMKSASDNAGELIESLQLAYNKARQAAITQELAEIVGGAAAV